MPSTKKQFETVLPADLQELGIDTTFTQLLCAARPQSVVPRPEFREKLRNDLRQLYAQKIIEKKNAALPHPTPYSFSLKNIWEQLKAKLYFPKVAFAPLLMLVLFGAVTTYAYTSPQVTRKNSLYILKKVIENLEVSLVPFQDKKIEAYLNFSERRLEEARYLARFGELDAPTIIEVNDNLNQALLVLQNIEDPQQKETLIAQVATTSQNNLDGLQGLAAEVLKNNEEYAQIAYASVSPDDQTLLVSEIPEEITSLAMVINSVATNTDTQVIENKLGSTKPEKSILTQITLSSFPSEILGYAGATNISATAFDQNGRDITASGGITFAWKILSGSGQLEHTSPFQVRYLSNGDYTATDDVIIEVIASQEEKIISHTLTIPFSNPIENIAIITNFGDSLDRELESQPSLEARMTTINNEYFAEQVTYQWEVIDGKIAITDSTAPITTFSAKQSGWVTVQLTVTYGATIFKKQLSFEILSATQPTAAVSLTVEPTSSSPVPKTKTPIPLKTPTVAHDNLFLKVTASTQAITAGDTVNIKFVVVDETWNLYPNEIVHATLSGSGTLSALTNHHDGTYTAIYTAPSNVTSDTQVKITGTLVHSSGESQTSVVITIYSKRIFISALSVVADAGDIVDVPLVISVPDYVNLRSYSFTVQLSSKLQLVSGASPTSSGAYLEGTEAGTRVLRLKVQDALPSQKISLSIKNATAVDDVGESIKVKTSNGSVTVKSIFSPVPTQPIKSTATPTQVQTKTTQ